MSYWQVNVVYLALIRNSGKQCKCSLYEYLGKWIFDSDFLKQVIALSWSIL